MIEYKSPKCMVPGKYVTALRIIVAINIQVYLYSLVIHEMTSNGNLHFRVPRSTANTAIN